MELNNTRALRDPMLSEDTVSLSERVISCPFCGHTTWVQLDTSNGDQDYYEDCANCCNPIHINVHLDEVRQRVDLSISTDNEQIY